MRYLGVDYGTKKIGLALSDEAGTMGFPHAVLPQSKHAVAEVAALAKRAGVGAIVVGESRDLSGAPNPVHAAAHAFGDALAEETGLPVRYESETFTSVEARRAPGKMPKSRAPSSREAVDASAAALILTSYLSSRNE